MGPLGAQSLEPTNVRIAVYTGEQAESSPPGHAGVWEEQASVCPGCGSGLAARRLHTAGPAGSLAP